VYSFDFYIPCSIFDIRLGVSMSVNKKSDCRTVSYSKTENTFIVLPEHTNPLGNLFGGTMMSWIDITGSIAAIRHCRNIVVTAAMDDLFFIHPVKLGDIVTMKASVNFTSPHSVEVGVKVFAENAIDQVKLHTASAYLTFVSLGRDGKVQDVPPVLPESAEEKKRYEAGRKRREQRLKRKK